MKEIVAQVRAGEIRVPTHQRPLRWKAPDVQKLFDSIWKGLLERARDAWRDVEGEAPERMRTALQEHWSRVPVLRALGGLTPG